MHFDCRFNLVNGSGKPIVHPLSNLTKEIEHNGEVFIPQDKIWEIFAVKIEEPIKHYDLKIIQYPFNVVIKLIEWHFDIAGLIEKGEAIDINTLNENPYK